MNDLYIEPTPKTPEIRCMSSGEISISGRSLPEDSARFFQPVVEWISDYYREPASFTQVKVELEYMNTSSASMFNKICFALERLVKFRQCEVLVEWIIDPEDEDMVDLCQDIRHFFPALPIQVHPPANGLRKVS